MTECYAGIPDEVLDSTWLDSDLARLSRSVVSWEELAPFWGLTEAEEEEIKRDNHSMPHKKACCSASVEGQVLKDCHILSAGKGVY